ncbi:TRAP transporter large permease subunit [uncultured Castellaniella sp.]|uniref:TRAP transporter large permease n=1 Tax=uncultured Castellaniella sp. TaxID=647907 RepID=UPI00260E488E|nr:TRAP transporter large permease subunit [uncultured Castellaniella sp.]
MTGIFITLVVLLAVLLSLGFWVGLSLLVVGIAGLVMLDASNAGGLVASAVFASIDSWPLTALPLFLLMGELLFQSKLSENMFRGFAPLVRWLPGRLLHVNVLGCGVLAAIVGSSGVCCATIGRMSVPELTRRGYRESMIIGTLTGSGTLGLLIPPSIMMIVYGIVSQTSIARLFLAGVLPGLVLMGLFMGYIVLWSLLHRDGVPEDRADDQVRWRDVGRIVPPIMLVFVVIGSIYGGWATPTESAVIGVAGAMVLATAGGSMSWPMLHRALTGTVKTSTLILLIIAGASVLTTALDFSGIPKVAAEAVVAMNLNQYQLLAALTLLYLVLGCFLEGVSMIVLTAAIVLPMTQAVGIDPVWFGIYLVVIVELAQITPPVGFNLFILQALTGRDLLAVAKASVPFFFLLVSAIVMFAIFPEIVLYLPRTMIGR